LPGDLAIVPFTDNLIPAVVRFTDVAIGQNYYRPEDLRKFTLNPFSFILLRRDTFEILGARLTLAGGQWLGTEKLKGAHPALWKVDPDKVAYFKSIFLADEVRGQSYGVELSLMALSALRKSGHKAVVCHSWNESPNQSSMRYLKKLGFKELVVIDNFWSEIDYSCTRCGKPCKCSATEMICHL